MHDQIKIDKEQVADSVFEEFESHLDDLNEARVGIVPLVKLF